SWTITPVPAPPPDPVLPVGAAPASEPSSPPAAAPLKDPDPLTIRAAEAEDMTGAPLLAAADPAPVVAAPAEPVVQPQPQPLSAMRPANSPPTGDSAPVEVLLSILLLSAGGMLYTLYQKKRI
ncbi:MAG: hypothetical protein IJP92_13410, partial [Lachnospiraceae bacterium]|nr:hypothetical protein [Lachnospiraceae bacterium]